MTEWRTDEPPIGIEIEYQREDGNVVTGALSPAGQFGIGNIAAAGVNMKRQYVDKERAAMFEVVRWRYTAQEHS